MIRKLLDRIQPRMGNLSLVESLEDSSYRQLSENGIDLTMKRCKVLDPPSV